MVYLPIELDVNGVSVIVAGGGPVGERKVQRLLAYGARVCLVASKVSPVLAEKISQGLIDHRTSWDETLLDEAFLVVAATSDPEWNGRLVQEARRAGCLVVSASHPDLGNVIFPAVVKRGLFSLAVSTNGASPALAAKVKKELVELYGPEYELMAELMSRLRPLVLVAGGTSAENASLFWRIIDSEQLWDLLKRKCYQDALIILRALVHPLELEPDFKFW